MPSNDSLTAFEAAVAAVLDALEPGDVVAYGEVAAEAGVPIHSDAPTARALFATTEIGSEIAPEHYRPVAAAIRFAEMMRKRARRWRR